MITLHDVKALMAQVDNQPVLSLYLNVDNAVPENQADKPAWRIWLKDTLRDIENGSSKDSHWQAIRENVDSFFDGYTPSSKGLVAFFGPDWQEIYALPVPVTNQSGFGDLLVGPLVNALDEYKPYLVVQVNQEEAHFYTSYLGQAEFQNSMEIDLEAYDFGEKTLMPATGIITGGGGHGLTEGSNRDAYSDMIEEHRARFFRGVVDYTRELMDAEGINRVILGGSEEASHAVHNHMPETLREKVVEITALPGHYSIHEIFKQIQPIALEYEHNKDLELVNDVLDKARAGGRAVLGPEATRSAFERQQVETLLLALDDNALTNELSRQALTLNSKIEIMHGIAADKLKRDAGGAAARLYYTINAEA